MAAFATFLIFPGAVRSFFTQGAWQIGDGNNPWSRRGDVDNLRSMPKSIADRNIPPEMTNLTCNDSMPNLKIKIANDDATADQHRRRLAHMEASEDLERLHRAVCKAAPNNLKKLHSAQLRGP